MLRFFQHFSSVFYSSSLVKRLITNQFHRLYYHTRNQTWNNTTWMGQQLLKCPFDLWIYQEIIFKYRPDVVIECGTCYGGSALYLANLMDLTGNGRVITIDIKPKPQRPKHARIKYFAGSSVSEKIVSQVKDSLNKQDKVLVILDSDHSKRHVLAEMKLYAPLVTPGSYMIVEDSNINGYPVKPNFGPGPMEAIQEFTRLNREFVIDKEWEKFFLTFNPNGFLRRLSPLNSI